jgi:hypothetical protein
MYDQATWKDAFSFCGKIGMSLMTIPNREKQAALSQYGKKAFFWVRVVDKN